MLKRICELKECGKTFETSDRRQRFCSHSCAASATTRGRKLTEAQKQAVSRSLKKFWKKKRLADPNYKQYMQQMGQNSQKGKHGEPRNIFDMSYSTKLKVIKRMRLPCSVCGWDEELCDLHHIRGRGGKDPHNHNNLTNLCPNCHRLAQRGLIAVEDLVTLEEHIGDKWLSYYYG